MSNSARQIFLPEDSSGITEVIMTDKSEGLQLVLPMLAHLSRQDRDRWLTWIAPPCVSREMLRSYGFAVANVRLIYTRDDAEALWVLWDALANGNSANVVAHLNCLSDSDRENLENAALIGKARGLVLSTRSQRVGL